MPSTERPLRLRRTLLWIVAILLTLSAAVYQRMTGPTYPLRGSAEVAGTILSYRLLRSHETTAPAPILVPDPDGVLDRATLHFRRFPTSDSMQSTPMTLAEGDWRANLPVQPAAGKMEYVVEVHAGTQTAWLPEKGDSAVLRYKDPVSPFVLVPHVFFMFFGMLFGVRAALSAGFDPTTVKKWTWVTLVLITVGGLILGPLVQKAAFGAYWTGWPFGEDLTDNKTLFMWIGWAVAAFVLSRISLSGKAWPRWVVIAAAVLMLGVYMVPHSTRGSQLNYEALEAGSDPVEAVEVGR